MHNFYSYSTGLNNVVNHAKMLLRYWSFRYKLIVDNSDRGQDCPYAKQAARLAIENDELTAMRPLLLALRDQIDKLIEESNETTDS